MIVTFVVVTFLDRNRCSLCISSVVGVKIGGRREQARESGDVWVKRAGGCKCVSK